VLCKLKRFGEMSVTHNKIQYRNKYNHCKILDSVIDLNYISFSKP